MEKYIKENKQESITILNKYPNLKNFIDKNKDEEKTILTLKTFIKDKDEIIKYDYYKYNKDIVLAYEYNFIINIDHINEYIKEQNEYLNSLSINDKYTIYDYTYNHSYTFYKNFKLNNKK